MVAVHRAILGGVVVFLDNQPLDQDVFGRALEGESGSRGLDQLAGRIVDEMDPAGGAIEEEPVGRELCFACDLLERLIVDEKSERERTGGMRLCAVSALDADLRLPRRNPGVAFPLETREHPSAVEDTARLAEESLSVLGDNELQAVDAGFDAEACAGPGLLDCRLDRHVG
ncbi:hypothetical protein [Bradyrhizobium sp.]|uniref:hypothetical protein n=1 Tax=Bradyrhizobium sp. TaxID=376 RepID=UPI0025BAD2C7|nr:hypothetical protein [Bradyrhizobium sp.]